MRQVLEKRRWLILLLATLGQCITNFPQGWAVFQPYIAQQFGYTADAATLVMPITVAFFGVSSILGGRFQDTVSPRLAGLVGTAAVTLAFVNVWWIPAGNPLYMYLGFSLFFGGGCGFVFQAIISTMMKWYADRMGFAGGFSGALSGVYMIGQTYVTEAILARFNARGAMLLMGIYSAAVLLVVVAFLVSPSSEYIEEKRLMALGRSVGRGEAPRAQGADFTPGEMLRTPQYYLLFAAIVCGLPAFQLVNPQLVTLCQSKGLAKELALSAVAAGSAATAVGRLVIPTLSDRLGRKRVMAAMWALTAGAAAAFMVARGTSVFPVWMALAFVYSGGYALIAPMTRDLFGFKNSGTNAGFVSISESVGSLLGPALLTLLTPLLGSGAVHIIGVAGGVLGFVCLLSIDMNTARRKAPAPAEA